MLLIGWKWFAKPKWLRDRKRSAKGYRAFIRAARIMAGANALAMLSFWGALGQIFVAYSDHGMVDDVLYIRALWILIPAQVMIRSLAYAERRLRVVVAADHRVDDRS